MIYFALNLEHSANILHGQLTAISNLATSIGFLRFDGEPLKPDISLIKVITEAKTCLLDAQK